MFQKRRSVMSICMVALSLTVILTLAHADVKVKTTIKTDYEGMGWFMKKMGNGESTTVASVKGDIMKTKTGDEIQIINLQTETVTNKNIKTGECTTKTFAQMKQEAKETREKMKGAPGFQPQTENEEKVEKVEDYEAVVDVSKPGKSKVINTFNTERVDVTITFKPKGKDIEEAGGTIITSKMWVANEAVNGYAEYLEQQRRVAEKMSEIYLPGLNAGGLGEAMLSNPMIGEGFKKLQAAMEEGDVPIQTVTTFEMVASKEQMEQMKAMDDDQEDKDVGGILGGFGKKIMKKDSQSSNRSTLLKTTSTIDGIWSDDLPATEFSGCE